jgi:predicted MFS family arabinose efflux permease
MVRALIRADHSSATQPLGLESDKSFMTQIETRARTGLLPDARRGTVLVLALACGVMVANVYICQPLLDEIARGLGVPERVAGLVAVATQIGFALGILFVVPLGDVAEPRRLVQVLISITTLGLLGAAAAPGIPMLILASLVVAAATVVPQVLIPLAVSLAPPERRGRVIGALQTGLILGILLSRTVAGLVASAAGTWRAPFLAAALISGGLLLLLPRFMPAHTPVRDRPSYATLLYSLPPLLRYRALRISAGLGFCVFGAFSAFWATLAFHLASPAFGLGVAATGLFGVWGAPGALVAPVGGRLADRIGPNWVNLGAVLCAGLAFVVAGTVGGFSVLALVVAVNLLDFGVQASQVANQARIFALGNAIRARLNTVYMVAVFAGGAFGSMVGTSAWSLAGWAGVCTVSGLLIVIALAILAVSALQARRDAQNPGENHGL